MTTWLEHVAQWRDCQACPLGGQRDRICLARGTLPADVLFIGEAPGVSEDALGQPFVGPAGQLLDRIIARALPAGIALAWTNLVACFPREAKAAGDNEPERGEILACRSRLIEFVNIAQPRLIVRVGKLATAYCNFDGRVPYADVMHPAWILRRPLAAQHGDMNKCVVTIRTAWAAVADLPARPWVKWGGEDHAQGKTRRQGIRQEYDEAEHRSRIERLWDDDIPF